MVDIKTEKGLDIPIMGKPQGAPQPLKALQNAFFEGHRLKIALDLKPFEEVRFKLLVRVDDTVKLGQPLLEDKSCPGRYFVAPAAGVVREVRRGLKRRLLDIVIDVAETEEKITYESPNLSSAKREELIDFLMQAGLFAFIRQRPFNLLADPQKMPRAIFVKALESAPFVPPAEMQVKGHEKEFQLGLQLLSKLTSGQVHLVYRKDSDCSIFKDAHHVVHHTAQGPHPISSPSLHIHHIDPIRSAEAVIWTVDALAVIKIGYLMTQGHYFVNKVIGIGGPGIAEGKTGYFQVREGVAIHSLMATRIEGENIRLISGDPLAGTQVEPEDYLGLYDSVFCAIPENNSREFLHFFRLGKDKYTFSRAYLSGHFDHSKQNCFFTTNNHGERRPFIDNTLYDQVMPLAVSTMHLVKAVMAEDYDLAASLGLLEVDGEDFLLPTFVCPSKIEMRAIIDKGLKHYAEDTLG